MRKFKQLIAVLLVVMLMLTTMPTLALQAMAQSVSDLLPQKSESNVAVDTENVTVSTNNADMGTVSMTQPTLYATATSDEILLAEEGAITRAEWLHNLVVTFDMTVESTALPDNYFSDLDESHEYYEDILLAVEFGVVDIAAGSELDPDGYVTRDFAASTLNFCLGYQLDENAEYTFSDSADCTDPASAQIALDRGWFAAVDDKFSPDAYITSEEIDTMLADAETILAGQIVDENYDSTYDFTDDVIVVEQGTFVTEDENGIISITDCPETILSGDKFAVYFNGIPTVYTANSVTVVDGVTSINTSTVEADQAFDTVDAQGAVDLDAIEITPVDGAEVSVETQEISTFAANSKKIGTINLSKKVNFAPGIQGSVSVKIHNPVVEYSVSSSYVFVALTGDTTVTYNLSMDALESAGLSKSVTIATCSIGGIGSFDVTVNFNVSGSATGSVSGYMVAGIECRKGDSIRAVKSFSQSGYYTNVEATANVGLNIKLGVTRLPIVSAYIYAEVGANAKLSSTTYSSDSPRNCTHFAAYLYAKYGASASVKFLGWSKSFNKNYDIFNYSNSPVRVVHHYEDGVPVARCARGTNYDNYFTYGTSRWGGCGWISADGAYGLNPDGTVFPLYNYTVENDTATITKYNANSWSVYIPKEIDGYTVVVIGDSAFQGKSVGYVSIPDTVKEIEYEAFYGCSNLKKVIIPESVTTISGRAFNGCSALPEITIPYSVTSIGNGAFSSCVSLTKIIVPDSVTIIDSSAFSGCTSLKEVTLSKNLKSMGAHAFSLTAIEEILIPKSLNYCHTTNYNYCGPFYNCPNLKTVKFETGTTQIAESLFSNCKSLEDITIPDTVTVIEREAFYGCSNLKKVIIPESVTTISACAFNGCSALPEITIPNSVTTIDDAAFDGCSNLKEITLSKNLKSMGHCAFSLTAIEEILIPKSLDYCGFYGGGPFSGCANLKTVKFETGTTQIVESLFSNCKSLEDITIPDTVTVIENKAFYGCSNLKKVIIPESVTTIEGDAFNGCTALPEITIPYSVTSIGNSAFGGCTNLKEITLSKNLKSMGEKAFSLTAIEEILIPKSLNSCGSYGGAGPFSACANLKTVKFETGTTKIANGLFSNCKSLEDITIPDTVTVIENEAFYGCSNLKKVIIPESVTTIEWDAFNGCTALLEIIIPNSVTTIEQYAFYGCKTLETVNFSDLKNLNEIHPYAFYGCTALKEAVLPESTNSVANYAFKNCTLLTKIYIPQSTKTIGSQAFYGCEMLTDVTVADYSITALNSGMFMNCSALEKIVLPKGLTTIGSQAFMHCTSLTEVTIPESVTSISSNAFSYPDKTTIYGKTGSYAETFAKENGFKFVDNTVAAEGISLVDGIEYIIMDRGETYRAQFEFYPENATDVITLTASNSNVTINGMDIYARYTGDTVITATASSGVTYEFTVHIRDAKSITITQQPTKLSYIMGDTLDLTGMTVQVTYNDGTVKDVTDYTVTGFDSSIEGDCTVTVSWVSSYGNTYETTFTVKVIDPRPKLTGIYIDTLPDKLFYERKESLDLTGMVVKATYTDGSAVAVSDYTISGYNALKNGKQTITVTYGDYTQTFTVYVGITVTGITITAPTKIEYNIGDAFNADGMTVSLLYSDGTTESLTEGYTVNGFDSDTAGTKTITVAYGDFSDSFTVNVKPPYIAGDVNGDSTVNNKDLAVLMQYINGWNVEINLNVADVNGNDAINNKDYALLMRYINGWDVELQ